MSEGFIKVAKARKGVLTASHKHSKKQERNMAEKFGGKIVKGSGNGFIKGDVRIEGVARIECKCTKNQSFSVTREMIQKLEEACIKSHSAEMPVFHIQFLSEAKVDKEVVLMTLDAFEKLFSGYLK